jgi:NTP pyrophosphatase (non-canonical NTP hydrolase)
MTIARVHCAMGLCTEAGEVLDLFKRAIFYGAEIPPEAFLEELGDVLWYLDEGLSACGWTLEAAMQANMAKLAKRYPGGFTQANATSRDTAAELDAIKGQQAAPIGAPRAIGDVRAAMIGDGGAEAMLEEIEQAWNVFDDETEEKFAGSQNGLARAIAHVIAQRNLGGHRAKQAEEALKLCRQQHKEEQLAHLETMGKAKRLKEENAALARLLEKAERALEQAVKEILVATTKMMPKGQRIKAVAATLITWPAAYREQAPREILATAAGFASAEEMMQALKVAGYDFPDTNPTEKKENDPAP